YPVGAPIPWPQATPPKGYLICNGEPFDKVKCPKLLIAYPSGKLPDLRGYFIRGWDAGKGVDPGREVFSYQEDAIRNITGRIGFARRGGAEPPVSADGAFVITDWCNVRVADGANDDWGGVASFDPSRVVPTANENRPRNIAFNYIVREA
ncbi:phage tail protein, partial [Arsenophonus nasoniae]